MALSTSKSKAGYECMQLESKYPIQYLGLVSISFNYFARPRAKSLTPMKWLIDEPWTANRCHCSRRSDNFCDTQIDISLQGP